MPHVVTDACIRCKFMDCVEVCPVDCYYEGKTMLVINPDECIDCGVCESECPVEAIVSDTSERGAQFAELNRKFSAIWPNVNHKKDPAPDADEWKSKENKYPEYFSEESGE
jgi:ferredoxin